MGGVFLGKALESVKQVDKELVQKRFSASAKSYEGSAIAQKMVHKRLLSLLHGLGRQSYEKVLEVGCGTASLTRLLDENFEIGAWTLNDLRRTMFEEGNFSSARSGKAIRFVEGDAEEVDLGAGYDLIISSSAIQWFHEPKAFLQSLYPRLNKGGILLISTFGLDNLREIRELTGQGLHYYATEAYEKALREVNFTVLTAEEESIVLSFDTARDVLRHLKQTGVTALAGAGQANFWTKKKLAEFEANYCTNFRKSDGKLSLTYQPIYLIARRLD